MTEDGHEVTYEFDVALSFAGENRDQAEALAELLTDAGVRVFYDLYEQPSLWGKDLYQHLQDVYRNRAQYCIIFTSKQYSEKLWTKHELKQAQARAFNENQEYILPLRLDDTEIPGINHTVGYLDLRQHTVEEVADIVCRKVSGDSFVDEEANWNGDLVARRMRRQYATRHSNKAADCVRRIHFAVARYLHCEYQEWQKRVKEQQQKQPPPPETE